MPQLAPQAAMSVSVTVLLAAATGSGERVGLDARGVLRVFGAMPAPEGDCGPVHPSVQAPPHAAAPSARLLTAGHSRAISETESGPYVIFVESSA